MPHRKTLILNGHPAERSLSRLFADTYAAAARARGHDVRQHNLSEMEFDMDFGDGDYSNHKPLEPDLISFVDDLQWSDHVVITFPLWWGSLPAKLKGLFDRAFLPGITFDTRNKTLIGFPKPLLTGRTAQMIVTADTPRWALWVFYRSAILHMMTGQVLKFSGLKPRKSIWFSGASEATPKQISKWIRRVESAVRTAS